jgi:nucleoside 2-deoxyribosyltransferase
MRLTRTVLDNHTILAVGEVKQKLYIAGPLFNDAERAFNARLKQAMSRYFEVFLPQEDGGLLADLVAEGVRVDEAVRRVFDIDVAALDWCQCILIVLDGRTIDEGAAFELGYAYAKGKRCVALQTDCRRLLEGRNNPMIDSAVEVIFDSVATLLRWAEKSYQLGTQTSEVAPLSNT